MPAPVPPPPSARYQNKSILYAWFAKEASPDSSLYYGQARYVGLALPEARISSTNAFVDGVSVPHITASSTIVWPAGTGATTIFLPCANLQLLVSRSLGKLTIHLVMSKGTDLAPVTLSKAVSAIDVNLIGMEDIPDGFEIPPLTTIVPFAYGEANLGGFAIPAASGPTNLNGTQIKKILINVGATLDVVTLHAAWLEYSVS